MISELISWIIGIVIGIYDWLHGLAWWVVRGMIYMVSNPEAFFKQYGLLILMLTVLVITIISILNWIGKRYLFQRVFLADPNKPSNKRYIGRKFLPIISREGTISKFLYRKKMPKERWDDFDGVIYFVYATTIWKIPIGFSANTLLVPSADRKTLELKGGVRWKKDVYIYYKGMKEMEGIQALVASNKSKSTTEAVGPDFYQKAGKEKLTHADKLAQKGVTANAESQKWQQGLGAVPHSQDYNEMTERELASVYLEEEEDEEVDPDDIPQHRVNSIMRELEVAEDGAG